MFGEAGEDAPEPLIPILCELDGAIGALDHFGEDRVRPRGAEVGPSGERFENRRLSRERIPPWLSPRGRRGEERPRGVRSR